MQSAYPGMLDTGHQNPEKTKRRKFFGTMYYIKLSACITKTPKSFSWIYQNTETYLMKHAKGLYL